MGMRWHQVIHLLDLSRDIPEGEGGVAILGFCCDEGVRRNQGRVGASAAPAALRQIMGSFADHLPEGTELYGCGDVFCPNQKLEEAQAQLGRKIHQLLSRGYKPVVLGGGHETAYGHFLGIQKSLPPGKTLGIINFDAHFDLRSYAQQSSSGTPFLQIAHELQKTEQSFHYLCLGIQEYGNTRKLFQTANELGTTFVTAQEMMDPASSSAQTKLQDFLATVDHVFLTIDLDVFAAAFAPGVSAPNAMGITPYLAQPLLQTIVTSGKLFSAEVVELNPTVDQDNRTARLAASLIYQMVQHWR